MRVLWVCLLACGSPERTPATPVETPIAIVMADAAIAIDAAPPAPIDATDPVLARRLDAVLDHAVAGPIVGAAVIVARDGVIVYAREAGMADREARIAVTDRTQFRIASMTKAIVTVAALALIDQKVLALDDPVTRWLPDFRPKLANGRQPVITVRHLLTHTSGLSYTFLEKPGGTYHQAGISDGIAEPGTDQATNLRRIASVPLKFAPGTRWSYGLSTDVLGAIIAKAGGAALPEVVARLVTRPLGMQDTVFVPTDRARVAWPYGTGKPPVRMTEPYDLVGSGIIFSPERVFDGASFPSGGAGLVSTSRDYLRFLEMLRTGGGTVLTAESARAMVSNQIGELPFRTGTRYGFGVRVLVDPAAKKSQRGVGAFAWGGVYGTGFWVDPEAKLSVVILTNVAKNSLDGDLEDAIYAK